MAKKKETRDEKVERETIEREKFEEMACPMITEEELKINESREIGKIEGENYILKQILEQKLDIELIPKFKDAFA